MNTARNNTTTVTSIIPVTGGDVPKFRVAVATSVKALNAAGTNTEAEAAFVASGDLVVDYAWGFQSARMAEHGMVESFGA